MEETTLIVVPCYNEAARLPAEEFLLWVQAHAWAQVLFVDDGSSDGTWPLLQSLQTRCERIHCLRLAKNVGKAEAVRQGVVSGLELRPDFIGYFDADLATPLAEVFGFRRVFAERQQLQAVFGLRLARLGVRIHRKITRHYAGRVVATAISIILNLPIYDSQCGAKLFRSELATEIFAKPFLSRWLFDVELLARIRVLLGREQTLQSVFEHPLEEWKDVGGSKLKLKDLFHVPLDLARIWKSY